MFNLSANRVFVVSLVATLFYSRASLISDLQLHVVRANCIRAISTLGTKDRFLLLGSELLDCYSVALV